MLSWKQSKPATLHQLQYVQLVTKPQFVLFVPLQIARIHGGAVSVSPAYTILNVIVNYF